MRLSSELYISATHRLLLAALQNRIKLWVEPAAGEMTLIPVFESASILDASEHIDKLLEFTMTALQCGDFAKYDEFLQTRRIWEKKMREGAEMEASLASVFSNVTGAIKDALFPTAMRIGRVEGVLQTVLRSMDAAINAFYGKNGTENAKCVLGQVSNTNNIRALTSILGSQILFKQLEPRICSQTLHIKGKSETVGSKRVAERRNYQSLCNKVDECGHIVSSDRLCN